MAATASDNNLKIFFQGTFIAGCGALALGVINYLIRRHLELNLPKAEYGFLYGVFALIMVFLAFLDLGLGQGGTIMMSRRLAAGDRHGAAGIYSLVFYVKLGGGILLFLALLAASPWLVDVYYRYPAGRTAFVLAALLVIFQALETCPGAALDALKMFGLKSFLQGAKIALILAGVMIWVPARGLNGAAAVFSGASLLMLMVAAAVLAGKCNIRLMPRSTLQRDDLTEIWRLCRWVALSMTGLTLITYTDTLILTWLRSLEDVALYNTALPIAQMLQVLNVIPGVFIPIVAELWHRGDPAAIRRLCGTATILLLMVAWATLTGTLLLGRDLITILFSDRSVAAAPALVILAVGMPLSALANFFMSALNAGHAAGKASGIIVIGVVANIVLNLLLISWLGIAGAALSTAGSYLLIGLLNFQALRRTLPGEIVPRRDFIRVMTVGIIISTVAWLAAGKLNGLAATLGVTMVLLLIMAALWWPVLARAYAAFRRRGT